MTRTYDITLAVFLYLSAATNTSSAHEGKFVQPGLIGVANHSLHLQAGNNVVLLPEAGKIPGNTRYNYGLQKAGDKKVFNVASHMFSDTINSMQ